MNIVVGKALSVKKNLFRSTVWYKDDLFSPLTPS